MTSVSSSLPPSTSIRRQILLPFFSYFLLLASTSFIAGGIVHLGLGENTAFYLALALVGVVFFSAGNYLQEFVLRKNARRTSLSRFLAVSFMLSVGIGMITGGIQHFLDNPAYSTVLIPAGLLLAIGAYVWREGVALGGKLPVLAGGTVIAAVVLFAALTGVSGLLNGDGHGHGHGHGRNSETTIESAVELSEGMKQLAVGRSGQGEAARDGTAAAARNH